MDFFRHLSFLFSFSFSLPLNISNFFSISGTFGFLLCSRGCCCAACLLRVGLSFAFDFTFLFVFKRYVDQTLLVGIVGLPREEGTAGPVGIVVFVLLAVDHNCDGVF